MNNGVKVPQLGFGTFKSAPGTETEQAVRWALECGYRHIDTAAFYGNEADVGNALKASGLPREEVFITTKVWNDDQGYDATLKAFEKSRKLLGTEIIDCYLIHWPVSGMYNETWKAMEKLYSEGIVRSIGVSNFLVHHLEDLIQNSDTVPVMNQVEFHPFLLQKDLLDYDRDHSILHEAWAPLTRAQYLDHEVITAIADSYGKSPAQILIRWDLQKGVVTIPKSVHKERIEENADVFDFELKDEEMKRLDGLDSNERLGPDPDSFV
jgi:diketogulonate reductase-like aldo/keto reductase